MPIKVVLSEQELSKLIAEGLQASMMKHGIGTRKDRKIMDWKTMDTAPLDRWILIALNEPEHPYIVAKYVGDFTGKKHYRWAKVGDTYQVITQNDCCAWIDIPEYKE